MSTSARLLDSHHRSKHQCLILTARALPRRKSAPKMETGVSAIINNQVNIRLPNLRAMGLEPYSLMQRFGSVIFFTDPDPDPTQKPKRIRIPDPDADPGKSTSNCVKRIRNTKRKNVRILPLGHNQISAVICRPISIFLNISKSQ